MPINAQCYHALVSHILILLLLLLSPFTNANCECGYTVNSTLYTDLLETDFLHLASLASSPSWQPQNYTVTPALARGPFGKNASLANVVANPLKNKDEWAGEGVKGGDAGLQLWVKGGVPRDGLVGMAEVTTVREDLLFGTWRVGMKTTGVGGTCGAFFWYYNDTQEIDMEFLSAQLNATSHPVNLVLQSPQSALANFNAANTSTFTLQPLPSNPATTFHEYRFDWSPAAVSFYADGALLTTMTDKNAIPTSPGHMTLSHWSNGNQEWSRGPPAEDAVLTVQYVKGYFNSSDPGRRRDWQRRCRDPMAGGATCVVPDIGVNGLGGGGETFFFSLQRNETGNQTTDGERGRKSRGVGFMRMDGVWATLLMAGMLWTGWWAC